MENKSDLKFEEQKIINYRNQFFRSSKTHLNNAGLAPISKPASDKVKYWAQRFYEEGFYTNDDYFNDVLKSRTHLSELIGCDATEIAFFQSTASAISQVALEMKLSANDEILMWSQEYSSNLYPWQEAAKRSGAKLVLVDSPMDLSAPLEMLLNHVTEKTKVIAISWVQFQTGSMTDLYQLGEFCRARNIWSCVDVMQGLGLHAMNFKKMKLDMVVGGSHKWLTSPVGVGFLALTQSRMNEIRPHNIGAYTYGTCDDPSDLTCLPKKDAAKFEPGSKQVLEITALGASIELILQTDVTNIHQATMSTAKTLREILEKHGALLHSTEAHSAILNWTHPEQQILIESLKKNSINFAIRGPGVRFSPHAFTLPEDLLRVDEVFYNTLKKSSLGAL